jgi:hypothetical protein
MLPNSNREKVAVTALHDALEEAANALVGDRAEGTLRFDDLQEWVVRHRGLRPPIGDVELGILQLHKAGRIHVYTEFGSGEVTIQPSAHSSARPRRETPTINVHGGHVQVGDHNRQTITYGSVMQTMIEKIEQSTLPEKEKTDLKAHLFAVLRHPLTQTIINGAVAFTAGNG